MEFSIMVEPHLICIFNDTGEIIGFVHQYKIFARVQALDECLAPQTFIFTIYLLELNK